MVYTPKNVKELRTESGSPLKKLSRELSLIGTEITPPQITQVYNVDVGRTDTYTETGAFDKPFKSIQTAILVANELPSANILINVAPGTYAGDFGLGNNISTIRGSGLNSTIFTGAITAGDRMHMLEEFRIEATGSLTITDNVAIQNVHVEGPVTVGAGGFIDARKILIQTGADVTPLTVGGEGGVIFGSTISTSGAAVAIEHTAGTLVIFHSYIANNWAAHYAINSVGGACGVIDTSVLNGAVGTGHAMNLDNAGSESVPNTVDGVVVTGNVVCGTKHTNIERLNFVGWGVLSGSNLIYRPATHLDNDSSAPGATVAAALDLLDGRVTTLEGV